MRRSCKKIMLLLKKILTIKKHNHGKHNHTN